MKNRSTQRTLGSMLLAFQSFVVFFGTLVAFGMQFGDAPTVWGVGLTLAVIAIVLPGILGRRGGYLIGWIYQAALLGLSIFIATINGVGVFYIVLSIIFLSLWIWAMLAGSTIDAARVAWQKANGIDPNNPDGQPEVFRIETDSEEK
ncbi:MAG: hypothetical protein RL009_938 [Actinomycetota bacterium]